MPTLEVAHLTKQYRGRPAISDLTFSAEAGDIVGFVGPNGAGKTTTIRILSTVLEPTSGEFRVDGVPGDRPEQVRRRIGVLPESAGYPEGRTAAEYLRFFARLYGVDAATARSRAGALLAEFGLADRADSPISTFSRGMRQRLGIARTVVNDPAVILLDEPTLGLDPAGQEQMLTLVQDLAGRRGATVLLSTHALPVVEQICSSVVVLDRGRMVGAGSVDELRRRSADAGSARLRVPAGLADAAEQALERIGRSGLRVEPDRSGLLAVSWAGPVAAADGADGDARVGADLLRAVLDAGIPVLSFDLDGGRLSDAFRSITGGGVR